MALFGKKNKRAEIQEKPKEKSVKEEVIKPALPPVSSGGSYESILSPHLTEKASLAGELNKYVFKVRKNSNKIEIKKAIEKIYKVKVKKVAVLSMPSKSRRVGRYEGKKPGFKKAIVTLIEGNKIELTG